MEPTHKDYCSRSAALNQRLAAAEQEDWSTLVDDAIREAKEQSETTDATVSVSLAI